MTARTKAIVRAERNESLILLIRGQKVMLDSDLAELYQVTTKRLNEQVRRNRERFPADFMFQLTPGETRVLRSQFATSNRGRGGRRYPPYAFTEHGAVMLASVLNSSVAVQASIQIVRAFVRLRQILASHSDLDRRLKELERRTETRFEAVFASLRTLLAAPRRKHRPIGFRPAPDC